MYERASQIPPEPGRPASDPAITSQEVETELAKVLASPLFRRAPRHSRFLEFVVRKKLAGSAECVKESLIGVEVFGRPADYDPGAEPAVRVEAGRLRSRLAEYYRNHSSSDPIHIDLPRGTYVPVFYRNGVETALDKETSAEVGSVGLASRPSPAIEDAKENPSESTRVIENSAGAILSRVTGPTVWKILAGIVAVGIPAILLIRMLMADSQPQAGRLEGSTLVVTNAKGQELWRKSFTDGFWPEYYAQGLATRMWFGDLERNGGSDIRLLYHPAVTPRSHSTTLICYSNRGKEKWRWTPGRAIPELTGDPATFEVVGFGVLKGVAGRRPRIVVSSSHLPWYPHQIAILSADGKLLSEYWHSGHLDYLTLADLDGDGREEIIATGISNGYHQATLVVLDPDHVFGASTEAARPELQIHGMGVAQERFRLLFSRSDLNVALTSYNEGQEATVQHGNILFCTLECKRKGSYAIVYEFNSQFHLLSARAEDTFRGFHDEFYRTDKHPHLFTTEEEREFQKVRCLVGCKTKFLPIQGH